MALVKDAECSAIAHLIINQVSQLECISELDVKIKIQGYLQTLEKKYNKAILQKCLMLVVDSVDDKYYNDGTSSWSDFQYDCFIECIKQRSSHPDVESKIGADVNTSVGATKLPYFMASMNKYKKIGEIKSWCRKFRGPYTVTAKLDGVSAMYHRGKLFTRGNGTRGRDISYLIPFLKQNVSTANALGEDCELGLRGELIIRKSVFAEKYSASFANSRNLVCGLLNRVYSKENEEFYQNIEFVVYDVYHYNPLQFCNKIKFIEKSGFQIVAYSNKIDSSALNTLLVLDDILKKWKTDYDYEIDGIIVTNDKPCIHSNDSNPDFAFAYKNNVIGVQIQEAVVDKVLWNVSKDNYLKPKIKLTEKVVCDGSQVEYVTGFNAKYILQNNIKNGTVVKIGLSGNVIPHIFEIVGGNNDRLSQSVWENLTHPISQKLLENIEFESGSYSWNKNKVDLISANNENPACAIKQNMVFFQSFELKCGLQETTLANLYKSLGIYKLEDVLSLNVEQWEKVEKVGTKKGGKIVNALQSVLDWNVETTKKIPEDYFMNWLLGLQCFPRGFGKKKLDSHVKYLRGVCQAHSLSKFSNLYELKDFKHMEKTFIDKVEEFKTPQVTSDSIQLFCQGFAEFIQNYNDTKNKVTNIALPSLKLLLEAIGDVAGEESNGCDKKGNIVFSGIRDKTKESHYLSQGYGISDNINSKTKILIVKDKNANTTKIKKALALGIDILSLNEI